MHIPREDLEMFGFTETCPGCVSLLKVTARQAHTEKCRNQIEEELRGAVKAEAAQRRVKEYQDKATEKELTKTKTNLEEGQAQRER